MSDSGADEPEGLWPLAWLWWPVTGAAIGFGIVALLTIGLVFLAVGLGMALAGMVMARTRNRTAYLALVGAAAAPLTLAWLNRGGPGSVCRTSGSQTECLQEWSPWPFLAVGLALIAGGVLLAARTSRQAAQRVSR